MRLAFVHHDIQVVVLYARVSPTLREELASPSIERQLEFLRTVPPEDIEIDVVRDLAVSAANGDFYKSIQRHLSRQNRKGVPTVDFDR